MLDFQDMLVDEGFLRTAHHFHSIGIGFLGLGERGQVVGLGRGLQHRLGLRHLVTLEDLNVGFKEAHDLLAPDGIPVDFLHFDLGRR